MRLATEPAGAAVAEPAGALSIRNVDDGSDAATGAGDSASRGIVCGGASAVCASLAASVAGRSLTTVTTEWSLAAAIAADDELTTVTTE